MTEEKTPIPHRRRSAARIAGVVTGAVASLIAVGLVALGAVALWANSEKSDDGYLSTDSQRFGAGSRALATENLDVDLDGGEWILDSSDLGDVRLEVASQNDKPVFVGIARTDEVSSYLRNVAHSTVTDIDSDPFEAKYTPVGGERKPVAPAEAGIWAASTHGRGIQTLNWEIEDGDWSVVVMNEDGSPGVYADISAGANIPFLDELGWTSMGSGALLFVAALGLVVLSVRPPRSGPGEQSGPAVAPAAA